MLIYLDRFVYFAPFTILHVLEIEKYIQIWMQEFGTPGFHPTQNVYKGNEYYHYYW